MKGDGGFDAGEGGAGDVDGGGHDVAAVEHLLHHDLVERFGVAAGAFVAGGDLLVDGGEEGAGAAGEVGDAEVADGVGVGPVHGVHFGDGEACEEGGGGGKGVEGGEVFAVGDKALEDAAGEVVGVVDACGVDLLGGIAEALEDDGGVLRVQLLEDVFGNSEDGPVVDGEDLLPRGEGLVLGVAAAVDGGEGLDALVHAGDALVEDKGVGEDGAGHAPGLGDVAHSEEAGDGEGDVGAGVVDLVQEGGGGLDALLQRGGGVFDGALGDGDEAHHVGYVLDGAFEPAGLGEAADAVRRLGEDAVGEAGVGEGGAEVVGLADGIGEAQGDGGFDDAPVGGDLEAETLARLGLDGGGGHVFGFDDDGGAVGCGDEDVGAEAGVSGDGLGVLGADAAAGQHGLEDGAQGVVGAWFGLAGHGGGGKCSGAGGMRGGGDGGGQG